MYIAGTDNLIVTVEYHKLSKIIRKYMKIVIGRNEPNEAPAMKMIHGLKNTSKFKHIFITTHYIAVQCRPISDYVSLG